MKKSEAARSAVGMRCLALACGLGLVSARWAVHLLIRSSASTWRRPTWRAWFPVASRPGRIVSLSRVSYSNCPCRRAGNSPRAPSSRACPTDTRGHPRRGIGGSGDRRWPGRRHVSRAVIGRFSAVGPALGALVTGLKRRRKLATAAPYVLFGKGRPVGSAPCRSPSWRRAPGLLVPQELVAGSLGEETGLHGHSPGVPSPAVFCPAVPT